MAREINIEYKSKDLWIPDQFIEVLSDYVCRAFENAGISNFSPDLQGLYYECDSNRLGESIGMVNINFDRFITSENDKNKLISLLGQTQTLILQEGNELSILKLNSFESRKPVEEFRGFWQYPIKTQSLTTTIGYLVDLLNGTWQNNNTCLYYTGFPNPPGVTEI